MTSQHPFRFSCGKPGRCNKGNAVYALFVVGMIVFAYLPTLQYDFAPGDQWRAFQYSMLDISPARKALACFSSRIYFDIRTGRPLCSLGECLEHAVVGEISDFSTTRPIVLMVVIGTAFIVGAALSPSLGGFKNGTAMGALFVFSPGYAFIYYRGLSIIMMLIALIMATISYMLIRRAINEKKYKHRLVFPAALFLAACMIYPAWAFVVFVFSLIDFLFCGQSDQKARWKRLLIQIIFFAVISLGYFLVIKFAIIFTRYVETGGAYAFSANFDPVYLGKRLIEAVLFFISQPPFHALSLPPLNVLLRFPLLIKFAVLLAGVGLFLLFRKNNYRFMPTFSPVFLSLFLLVISIAPWLVSNMANVGNRYFISFSLFACALLGWIIIRVFHKLFPGKKYFASVFLLFLILLPASAIQNKRAFLEVYTSNIEIETMRALVHHWIDENEFRNKRYIVVVRPEKLRPVAVDRALPLINYGDSFLFSGEPSYYFQMFTALIREKCGHSHPLIRFMNIYNLSPGSQKKAEALLDDDPLNIVFTVVNQGERLQMKHEVFEINFSFLTDSPESLIVTPENFSDAS